jgi:hypothetical protein
MKNKKGSKRCSDMKDPIMTYIRMVEDLERIAMTEEQPFDPILINEILELKEELAEYGYVYFDGHSRPFRLTPAVAPHKQNAKN